MAALLIERGARADPCQLAALGWTERLLRRIDADPGALAFRGRIGVHEVVGTPLHAAVHAGHGALAAVLIGRGADANARADMGQTPLHMCATAGLARLLIEAGADPAAVDDEHGDHPPDVGPRGSRCTRGQPGAAPAGGIPGAGDAGVPLRGPRYSRPNSCAR